MSVWGYLSVLIGISVYGYTMYPYTFIHTSGGYLSLGVFVGGYLSVFIRRKGSNAFFCSFKKGLKRMA